MPGYTKLYEVDRVHAQSRQCVTCTLHLYIKHRGQSRQTGSAARLDGAKHNYQFIMDYSLEMITTVAECDALLLVAGEDQETLERRRRNLDESIDNFGERTHDYGTEMQAVITLLETYNAAYGGRKKQDDDLPGDETPGGQESAAG
jgi:hypothetical protein